ncbi:acyl-CoA synthetase FdrA [Pseudodesulfovibrio sp. JC047]|uniref:acyl-CoA synthetase FdrA n=1 Tax=Pseudodesulfovibrio sp. JC047 TaxID=2683199 RepID=UPI0013D24791|nr:acyl-CoA synthetase FdrA [Pseudodesulfovibrio sp. JC047]
MKTDIQIHQNIYQDSVALMRISAGITALPGIEEASALMGTPANMDLLIQSGLLAQAPEVKPSDLVLVIKGEEDALPEAFASAADALTPKDTQGGSSELLPPISLLGTLAENPDANLALISTPGEFAGAEALKALSAGLNVMLFSDNVPVEQEIALKKYASAHDLLVMGPDCGTAIIGGAPLAFANVVRQGSIGVVGASGTGIQQVTCLIDQMDHGISQAIGTGGHDLSHEVGGLTMLSGIKALAEDPQTRVIVLISKPPAKDVTEKVLAAANAAGKPVVVNFLGADASEVHGANLHQVATLEEAAHCAVALDSEKTPSFTSATPDNKELQKRANELAASLRPEQKYLRGLYTGGTFCFETQLLMQDHLPELFSNGPTGSVKELESPFKSQGHTVVDLGDDVFTRGKPHPMIDPTPRNERVLHEIGDPETAVILLDVVLGYGSHEDPAGALAQTIAQAKETATSCPVFIASVCGTEADPQNLAEQRAKLEAQGVALCPTNAEAAVLALLVATRS